MKTFCYLLLALTLTSVTTGCQQCLARLRGARCRPGLSLPSLRMPRAQPQVETCNGGCNQAPQQQFYVQPEMGMPVNGTAVEGVVIDPQWAPQSDQSVDLQRPIVTSGPIVTSSPIVQGASGTTVLTVPGPEAGPLPAN